MPLAFELSSLMNVYIVPRIQIVKKWKNSMYHVTMRFFMVFH